MPFLRVSPTNPLMGTEPLPYTFTILDLPLLGTFHCHVNFYYKSEYGHIWGLFWVKDRNLRSNFFLDYKSTSDGIYLTNWIDLVHQNIVDLLGVFYLLEGVLYIWKYVLKNSDPKATVILHTDENGLELFEVLLIF